MSPSRSITRFTGSGCVAGPRRTAPVRLSNTEPWHGQCSAPSVYSTWHPAWVQMAEHAVSDPDGRRTTTSGSPFVGSRYRVLVPARSSLDAATRTAPVWFVAEDPADAAGARPFSAAASPARSTPAPPTAA